jgi:hypothetical protein
MCTFEDERRVMVCDVAIGQVRQTMLAAFGDEVQYLLCEGQGTLVEASASIDAKQFQTLARTAISQAQAEASQTS